MRVSNLTQMVHVRNNNGKVDEKKG
jgi:hypothetical protein